MSDQAQERTGWRRPHGAATAPPLPRAKEGWQVAPAPDGRETPEQHKPVQISTADGLGCFACALGGDDGRSLLDCVAPDFLEHNRRREREAVLLTATVEVPHAGLP